VGHAIPPCTYKCDHYKINLGAYGEICDKGTPPMEAGIFPDPLRVIPKETALENGLQGRITLEHIRKFAKAAKRARKTFSIYPRHDELSFWSNGKRGHGVIVARCQAVPNLLMFTNPVAPEVDGQRKPYVGGLNALHRETE
jgi:hypothetical protein